MPYPSLSAGQDPIGSTGADALVLLLPPLTDPLFDTSQWEGLRGILSGVGFTGKLGSSARIVAPDLTTLPVLAVGRGAQADQDALRFAAGTAARTLTGFERIEVRAPGCEHTAAIAEGAALGGYRFDGYKSHPVAPRASEVLVAHASAAELAHARVVGGAVALVKDLVSTPAEWLGPADLAERAVVATQDLPIEVTVWDEERLRADGFGGILGVGQGSDRPPRLVRLDYAPESADRHVALVGKGITFDTGGLSLKPAGSMVGMKYDMCGAATALAVTIAAAELRLPVRVTAWLCVADNMPSGRATRPGDVLRIADGTTVEVLNTDAEGRLVLADGLVAASREEPDLIVDIATLTGAITVALGTRHVGVMGEDAAVAEYLSAAALAGEPAWQLPLPEHMEEDLDSPIADLVNAKIGDPAGGSMFAGLFLRRFVGEKDRARIPWVHLDIAGVGMNKSGGYGFTEKGPTGATVRSLIRLLQGEA